MSGPANHPIAKTQPPLCIILAAGASTRLRPMSNEKPKCLLEIGDKTLLERAIENVRSAGVKSIAIVVGYREEMIRNFLKRRFADLRLRVISNPDYAATNNAYSLWLTKSFLVGRNKKMDRSLLLLDSDILFSSKLLPRLLDRETTDLSGNRIERPRDFAGGVIAVRRTGLHDEEEVRVSVDDKNNIVMIGKDIPSEKTFGESIGIEVFSSSTVRKLFRALQKRVRSENGRTEFYEASFQQLINEGTKLKALDVSAFPAIEIDTPEDLRLARRLELS